VPEQLLFVRARRGPFALGYGRAQVEPARFDARELIRSALPPDAIRAIPARDRAARPGARSAIRACSSRARADLAAHDRALGVLVGSVGDRARAVGAAVRRMGALARASRF
jgi:hypothetical protein